MTTYKRDDGAVMIEIAPHVFVNEHYDASAYRQTTLSNAEFQRLKRAAKESQNEQA